MTDSPTPTTDSETIDELPDPEALRDRDDVDYREDTVVHDEAHLELNESIDGRAIVGLTDAEGRLLLRRAGCDDDLVLPHPPVEPGEDFAAVARRGIDELAGIDVVVDGVERVRRVEFRLEGDEQRRTTVHHVVLRASPRADATGAEAALDVTGTPDVDWFDEAPESVPEGEPGADLRLFLE